VLSASLVALLGGSAQEARAAKLVDVAVLDRDYLVVHFSDGEVVHDERAGRERVVRHTPELETGAAAQTASWTLWSSEDPRYRGAGLHPQRCHRKTRLSGHAQMEWVQNDYRYESTYDHWIYLRLPHPLQQGVSYTLEIAPGTHSDVASRPFTFDVFHSRSEAVHVNLAGYAPQATHKAADLYHWMGDGGARDYSSFEGHTVSVYDTETGEATPAGVVSFWRPAGRDVGQYDLTRSDVWSVDFSSFTTPGTYRLVVEGVGCSQDFEIASDVYAEPFRVAVRGYYYMRIGEPNPRGISPPPRSPLYVPGTDPPTTTVYLTSLQPWHPDWKALSGGDIWDRPKDWAPFRKPGNPTNPDAWGGHSDAADWDRHLGHVVNVYDMLLPFLLTDGPISDDDTGITESGNGIPDILDEARWEVDFWLRLRDGDGYSHGLTNPNERDELFQAGPTAIAAWANAANAAMLADAFRVADLPSLMAQYRDAAVTAYQHANGLADPQLDEGLAVDDGFLRGRDLKMMAAAFLYNVTGTTAYEDVVQQESVCVDGPATLKGKDRNQTYGSAAYLTTPRAVHYSELRGHMRASIIREARQKEAGLAEERPSRRATDEAPAFFRTGQNVQRTIIAHAVAEDPVDRDFFRRALALEAGWGLGRNPLNMIQMTTASTPLASKRSVPEAYTSGVDDGVEGVHPGHTPYMNLNDWGRMKMGRPSVLFEGSHPANVKMTWPIGEAYFPSRWVWAHNEFTPRQTMRGKLALYAYLHGLAASSPPEDPSLTVARRRVAGGMGKVTSSPPGIVCGDDCSEAYPGGTTVTLAASPARKSAFAGWSGACSGTGPCTVSMTAERAVTATFEPEGLTYTLSLGRSGSGGGTVTSSPPGIDCGSDCEEDLPRGTRATLSASADDESVFGGWGGACSGADPCFVTMNAARSVTAAFRSLHPQVLTIYHDALAEGWANWSWGAKVDLAAATPVKVGHRAVAVTLQPWGAFSPRAATAIDPLGYDALRFWVHGGTGDDKTLRFFAQTSAGAESASVDVTAVAGTWTEVTVPLSALGDPSEIARLNFMNSTGSLLPTIALDEIRLVPHQSP
jgi:endoglucanase